MTDDSPDRIEDAPKGVELALPTVEEVESEISQLERDHNSIQDSTTELDTPVLGSLRWIDRNIAWLGGFAMLVVIAAKIAFAAHLNLESMDIIVQATSINDLTVSTISNLLPVSPFIAILLIYRVASTSANVYVAPITFAITVLVICIAAVIDPLLLFIELFLLAIVIWGVIFRTRRVRRTLRDYFGRLHGVGTTFRENMLQLAHLAALRETMEADLVSSESKLQDVDPSVEPALVEKVNQMIADVREQHATLDSESLELQQKMQGTYKTFSALAVEIRASKTAFDSLFDVDTSTKRKRVTHAFSVTFVTIAVLAVPLLLGVGYASWMPSRQFEYVRSHLLFSGYELNEGAGNITILKHSNRQVVELSKSSVAVMGFCVEPNATPNSTLYQLLLSSRSQPQYPMCVDEYVIKGHSDSSKT